MSIIYKTKQAKEDHIYLHLCDCDDNFMPPLSRRVDLKDFAAKIADKTITFEAWDGNALIGLVSAYFNEYENLVGFINNVSVVRHYMKRNIGSSLIKMCVDYAKMNGFKNIRLEVLPSNTAAIHLYEKHGFERHSEKDKSLIMQCTVKRDFNQEIQDTDSHKYAYNFDFDVMHPFMVKSFQPFLAGDENVLELGSFKGAFTKRLVPLFEDIHCVEASSEAIAEAKKDIKYFVRHFHSTFETVTLPRRYDNIIMTHVLEHLDDPVAVLKRVNDEWLNGRGARFFVACPNANAPSRQIAVKMGLITHNTEVTPSEAAHGHKITYTLDTLERDAKAAGLKVIHRGGIFFKALANFQWDKILKTDIISHEYLEGCFELGQQYPDLCSSIFLVCEKGNNEQP